MTVVTNERVIAENEETATVVTIDTEGCYALTIGSKRYWPLHADEVIRKLVEKDTA